MKDFVPRHIIRALQFLDATERGGLPPTKSQLDSFATVPEPFPGAGIDPMAGLAATIIGFRGMNKTGGQPVADYLLNLQWASFDGNRMVLSPLGRAILQGLDDSSKAPSEPVVIALEPGGPVSYVAFARAVSDAGAGMVIDPFFKANQLEWFASSTRITRVLMSRNKGQASEVELVAVALGSGGLSGQIEVRSSDSDALHDRAIVHESRSVTVVGTSVSGLKKHLSYLATLNAHDAESFRHRLEELWDSSDPIEPKRIQAEPGSQRE